MSIFKKLKGTVEVQEVSIEDMARAYIESIHRGYNQEKLHINGNTIYMSSPSPNTFIGEHYTLVTKNVGSVEMMDFINFCILFERDNTLEDLDYFLKNKHGIVEAFLKEEGWK